jgi:two-component system cell cycle sensor histidine kinase/response regulator CckA
MKAPLPPDESQRLRSLREYNVMDSPPEAEFDELSSLAAHICQAPVALISFVDESRQWFKSHHGLQARQTPRDLAFCAHAILQKDIVMEVPDARADPRFAENELVTASPHIRFYAGAPLISRDGLPLGTLCVIDHRPRRLEAAQTAALSALSRQVMTRLELHRQNAKLMKSEQETQRLLALAEKSRAALLSVLEDEQQTGRQLRESEARFRELAETIDEVFWITDPLRQQMLYISPAYETIWQRTCTSLCAAPHHWLAAIHPDDRLRVMAAEARQARGDYDETYRILRPDGSVRWIHDRAFPVRDSQGLVLRIVGTAMDITESKNLESQYLRVQRMESIGTLAGGIAHDLNNVLAPIMMSIELLKRQEQNPLRLSILTTIEGSARRGAEMVRQVLSFARGVEGRQLRLQVGHLLREVEKIVQDTFAKNILVRCDVPSDLWVVQGDPTQLHQVLLNLCVNARDAMPRGGTLTLAASNLILDEHYAGMNIEASPGPHVRIVVVDNGEGMPPEIIERIFEPFFTTKEPGKGTGLGLSTTAAIIKSHGGFVRVESKVGEGTQFQVFLPAQKEPSLEGTPETPAPTPPSGGNGELVLVVDDEDAVRQLTQHTLESFGYRVVLAADGIEAVSIYAARKQEIAVVLTDMMMPVMDGPRTIQVLLRINPQVRIIAASGLHADAASMGVRQFIPKPYTAETLLKTMHEVLQT